jgi:hypothetical protein
MGSPQLDRGFRVYKSESILQEQNINFLQAQLIVDLIIK